MGGGRLRPPHGLPRPGTARGSGHPLMSELAAAEASAEWFAHPPLRYRPSATVRVGDASVEDVPATLQQALDERFGSLMLFPSAPRAASTSTESQDPTMARV